MTRWRWTIGVAAAGLAFAQGASAQAVPWSRANGGGNAVRVAPPPTVVGPPAFASPPTSVSPGVGSRHYFPAPGAHYHAPRPRVGVDVWVGSPWYRPWYGPGWGYPGWGWAAYPPPVVVAAPVVMAAPPNVVYVERPPEAVDPVAQAAPVPGYWYWCAEPQGWYPDVRECPQGWQPVPPRASN